MIKLDNKFTVQFRQCSNKQWNNDESWTRII